ncbi:MAG: FAD-binding oxidoreductase [Pseudomonadota bacterium]
MATIDLTIRGAGVFGLATAWEAVRRGAKVRVIDPAGPGSGASGGVVGALAPHAPENWNEIKGQQFGWLIAARDYWPEVEAASGLSTGYRQLGRLQPIPNAKALARAQDRAAAAETLWQGQAQWSVTNDPGPWAPVSPTEQWIEDTLSAQLDPAAAVAALAAAIQAAGGEILADGDEAGAVVHATGWRGLQDLSAELRRQVGGGVKGQAAVLAADPGLVPQIFADGIYAVAHKGGRVAIGSTSEREFDDPTATDTHLDDLISEAKALIPALRDAPVIERWAGVRPRAVSRVPLVGAWPDRPGHFVANGGFKIGFAAAPAVAKMIVDLALDDIDGIPDGFRMA